MSNKPVQSTAHEASPHAERDRRTKAATDRKIMQAVLQIALHRGIGDVTIEEVSRVSGVAKTTIYRRYRNSKELLHGLSVQQLDALTAGREEYETSRAGFARMITQARERFDTSIGITSVGLVLSSDSEFFVPIVEEVILPIKQRFASYIERGQREGDFREGLDADYLFATILGSMVACEAFNSTAGDSWTEKTTDLIWPLIAA